MKDVSADEESRLLVNAAFGQAVSSRDPLFCAEEGLRRRVETGYKLKGSNDAQGPAVRRTVTKKFLPGCWLYLPSLNMIEDVGVKDGYRFHRVVVMLQSSQARELS
jgi:hypothetical protein